MSLAPFALESHVDEALRLFKVSTLDAAMSGSLSGMYAWYHMLLLLLLIFCDFWMYDIASSCHLFQLVTCGIFLFAGAEGFTSSFDQEEVRKIERQLKTRFPIGSHVSEQRIMQDFIKQNYTERAIQTVIQTLIRRGELQHRFQRKVLLRIR